MIASYVHAEVAGKRRTYGDFLVITRLKPRLGVYAEALDALEIPMEVSGAGAVLQVARSAGAGGAAQGAGRSARLRGARRRAARAALRAERPRPLPVPAGWRPVRADVPAAGGCLIRSRPSRPSRPAYGPVAARHAPASGYAAPDAPPAAGRARSTPSSTAPAGWPSAATTPGGARAGHLLQAIDEVRQVVESGGGLADAADALIEEEEQSTESEALPLEPGRRNVVRLMNLHKAKGLEAPVVILADPLHTYEFPISLRVERDGGLGDRDICVSFARTRAVWAGPRWPSRSGGTCTRRRRRSTSRPSACGCSMSPERGRRTCSSCAGRRTRSRTSRGASSRRTWMACQRSKCRSAKPVARKLDADLSAKARAAADAGRAARHDAVQAASWAVATPTGEKARLAAADRAKQVAADAAAAAAVPDTAEPPRGRRCGVGHASARPARARHAAWSIASREDLARLALWLTVEHEELQAVHSRGARVGRRGPPPAVLAGGSRRRRGPRGGAVRGAH